MIKYIICEFYLTKIICTFYASFSYAYFMSVSLDKNYIHVCGFRLTYLNCLLMVRISDAFTFQKQNLQVDYRTRTWENATRPPTWSHGAHVRPAARGSTPPWWRIAIPASPSLPARASWRERTLEPQHRLRQCATTQRTLHARPSVDSTQRNKRSNDKFSWMKEQENTAILICRTYKNIKVRNFRPPPLYFGSLHSTSFKWFAYIEGLTVFPRHHSYTLLLVVDHTMYSINFIVS